MGIAFELAFAAALVYTPPLQAVFGTAALSPRWRLFLLACIPLLILAEEGRMAARTSSRPSPPGGYAFANR